MTNTNMTNTNMTNTNTIELTTRLHVIQDGFAPLSDSLVTVVIDILKAVEAIPQPSLKGTFQPLVDIFARPCKGVDRGRIAAWVAANTPLVIDFKDGKLEKIKFSERAVKRRVGTGSPIWDYAALILTPFWDYAAIKVSSAKTPDEKQRVEAAAKSVAKSAWAEFLKSQPCNNPQIVAELFPTTLGDIEKVATDFAAAFLRDFKEIAVNYMTSEKGQEYRLESARMILAARETEPQATAEKEAAQAAENAELARLQKEAADAAATQPTIPPATQPLKEREPDQVIELAKAVADAAAKVADDARLAGERETAAKAAKVGRIQSADKARKERAARIKALNAKKDKTLDDQLELDRLMKKQ